MNFNCFSTHDYVDPDDPLTKPHPGFEIEQQNCQISILQQQLQQSQTAYQDIVEKINSLEVDKQKKASKSKIPPLKLYKSSKLPVKKSDNCLHKSNPYQLIKPNTPPDFQYTKALLSKLGIHQWAPNLEEASDTLYNEACQISAIQSFCKVAIGGAYEHMNINLRYLNGTKLLHDTYNYYVHYYMAQRFEKEMKEGGKHRKDQEKGAIQLSRKRLCDIRYKFGVANNFPKRYLKVLAKRDAHSNDEDISKNTYKIKKLVFRSNNANKFMR
ncbi:hypothetical protein O181_083202 [Austropuccinia psidii MF-1]|uniref:Uncharacterized protein n=1 Tax=Austropuccinia psidii MF-1 TaxID=1389203 RepID=A0A9Q3FRW9_9BASI|nr:hypothetical protein [Austropuccinia psidii MF-1]